MGYFFELSILTMKFLIFFTTLSILGLAQGEKCQNPKVQASSYTPSAAQVLTHIAFVAEFSLSCSNGASNVALYADLNGALVPVVRSQDAGGRYQISWTTEVKHAKTGDHEVNLYDEEGYTAAKRTLVRTRGPGSTRSCSPPPSPSWFFTWPTPQSPRFWPSSRETGIARR